jgi:Zn-dependent protease
MDNPLNWSFPVGKLFGISIRLHLLFIIISLWLILNAFKDSSDAAGMRWHLFLLGGGSVVMLFVIVLTHELGHCWGARMVGGDADEILLWPLGGLAMVNVPNTPRANMVTVAAGPMVNVIFCMITTPILVVWTGSLGGVPWNPLHPMSPVNPDIIVTWPMRWLLTFYGLNYVLLIFNLLPVFPLDGGRMLQAILWKSKGRARSMEIAIFVGMIGAIALGLLGLLTNELLIIGIAVFGYIECYRQRQLLKEALFLDENEFGYDFSRGYKTFEQPSGVDVEDRPLAKKRPGYFARKRLEKALEMEKRERERIEHRARRVDQILDKIARSGVQSLTEEEQEFLKQETERQRTSDDH